MSKHTPGPWEAVDSIVFAINESDRDEAGNRVGIAQCGDELVPRAGLKYGAERDANARLIAAAPELLEALANLVHFHVFPREEDVWQCNECLGLGYSAETVIHADDCEIGEAEYAIAKARGKEAGDG